MKTLVLILFVGFASSGVLAAATLTGATLFASNSEGLTNLEVWNTLGGDLIFNLYLREGTTALNSGNGAATRISLPLLTAGTYTINYRAQPGLQSPTHFGLNLFFGGDDQTPGISAVVKANGSTFAASSSFLTHRLDGLPVLSSGGTLQYIDGDYRVTLSALSHERAGGNTVGAFASTPGLLGGNDYRGSFTLQVAVPDPGTYLLFGTGLVGLAYRRRRR
ncbi:MAG: PEP-CTERM sorting domain-containing protein [Acidobacteriota bacterium]|jgi:hypothetical protein|nr:PEP-CTERM sorting domain-containing protein [Acidobacteriaceae bacterium]